MAISTFDLFKIGIGPSSSHTVGPMRAARMFALALRESGLLSQVLRVRSELYGSLGATGKGHGTDKAVLLGLEGQEPDQVNPDAVEGILVRIRGQQTLQLLGVQPVPFGERDDLVFLRRETLPFHPNGMRFVAYDAQGSMVLEKTYYSVGGGFVVSKDALGNAALLPDPSLLPFPFRSGDDILKFCADENMTMAQMMWRNELTWRTEEEIRSGLMNIWRTMQACVQHGLQTEGVLHGGMKVKRRAPGLYRQLVDTPEASLKDQLTIIDWVNLYAMAVNEENAAGGRVVTAPTTGAAGIIPAVMH